MAINLCELILLWDVIILEVYMKILLIGNGFDLAHGLPTKYTDFLDLCEGLSSGINPLSNTGICRDFYISVGKHYFEFKGLIGFNAWLEHFKDRRRIIGDSWIDFETEIKEVVMLIYNSIGLSSGDFFCSNFPVISSLDKVVRRKYKKDCTYKMYFDYLYKELIELTRAMNIYFDSYVNFFRPDLISYFSNHKYDRLLSFNYTNTYTNLYATFEDDFQYCYIHGKTKLEDAVFDCPLVLGYDDHYLEDGKAILETIPFEKYYQRIIKQTDNCYLNWIDDINTREEESELHIYGHSLAQADGDILAKFIDCEFIKTSIFYLNEEDRANKVANLATVLGPDKLIELAGGTKPQIVFKKID